MTDEKIEEMMRQMKEWMNDLHDSLDACRDPEMSSEMLMDLRMVHNSYDELSVLMTIRRGRNR